MNSKSLRSKGFNRWYGFSMPNEDKLLCCVPQEKGVYVIKYKRSFGRFLGKSDIMYFGSSKGKKYGLHRRIRFFFHPGKGQGVNWRINKWLRGCDGFSISFKSGSKVRNPREQEESLLRKYEQQHGEFPPWNRRYNRRKKGGVES